MNTHQKVKIVIYTGNKDRSTYSFKTVELGEQYETEEVYREALHELLDDDLDCMIEKLEEGI